MMLTSATLPPTPYKSVLYNRLVSAVVLTTMTLTGCFQADRDQQNMPDSDAVIPMAQANHDQAQTDTATLHEGAVVSINGGGANIQDTVDTLSIAAIDDAYDPEALLRENVSQQFMGVSPTQIRLASALPELPYEVDDLSEFALAVNNATLTSEDALDEALIIKIQALLNYHHHNVGAVDGRMGRNVIKAMQIFQEKHGLAVTEAMNAQTWYELTRDQTIMAQPVLVNYTLTQKDVSLPYHRKGQQYHSVREKIAEKFHMSQGLLSRLNPNTRLRAGNTIVVYNPYQPNAQPVERVVVSKNKNILYAYDDNNELVASYPTTVGSRYKPSPSGHYEVRNRVINPSYNSNFSNKYSVLPPGPNNPVGRVWMGISKQGYGIHGSPNPEKISQQQSSGCVRLTNWDALGLFGTMQIGAKVEFE